MIDEKLNELYHSQPPFTSDDVNELADWQEAQVALALTAIYEIGLEVIGITDYSHDARCRTNVGEYCDCGSIPNNQLRASQRKAWAKACRVAEK